MAKANPAFGPPDADFAKLRLHLVSFAGRWLRIHHKDDEPIYFSQAGRSRWDARAGRYGTMCLGRSLSGIVLERFGDQMRLNGGILTDQETRDFRVALIRVKASTKLRAADIRNEQLFYIGADSQLFSGSYAVAQQWSLAFMEHPLKPAGVIYQSRHNPKLTNLVLFDRAGVIPLLHEGSSIALRDLPDFNEMLYQLRIGVTPPVIAPTEPPP